jgi:guanylate kinase
VAELLKLVPELDFSISYTTRNHRGSEQNGKQYYFVSRTEFEKMIRDEQFLEYADVFGNYYGTARRFLKKAEQNGHDLLLDIDVQGARQIHQKLPEAISIFILPPDLKTLEWRLRKRSEDDPKVIERRLATATREIEDYDKYTYILVNDRLEESVDNLLAIVRSERVRHLRRPLSNEEKKLAALAERCRLANMRERIKPILDSFRSEGPAE